MNKALNACNRDEQADRNRKFQIQFICHLWIALEKAQTLAQETGLSPCLRKKKTRYTKCFNE